MKTRIIITLGIVLGLLTTTFAQKGERGDRGDRKEEKKAQRIAFITERLALTPDESKVFWPVYEQRNEERKTAIKAIKGDRKENPRKKLEEMSDAEVKTLLDNMIKVKQTELDIQKKYNDKFLSILPPKKVAKLYHVEREFKKHRKDQRPERRDNNRHGENPDNR